MRPKKDECDKSLATQIASPTLSSDIDLSLVYCLGTNGKYPLKMIIQAIL